MSDVNPLRDDLFCSLNIDMFDSLSFLHTEITQGL